MTHIQHDHPAPPTLASLMQDLWFTGVELELTADDGVHANRPLPDVDIEVLRAHVELIRRWLADSMLLAEAAMYRLAIPPGQAS